MTPEDAVIEAIKSLAKANTPRNRHTVLEEAAKILEAASEGKMDRGEAWKACAEAAATLEKRGTIDAPIEPHRQWKIK